MLIVNLITGFRVSIFQQFLEKNPGVVERIVAVGFEEKAFSLFALLFGVGLAIQHERLSRLGRPLYWLTRRLVVLLAFGLVHLLFVWNGDILTEYALAGFVALPFLRLRPSALLVASLCFLALYVLGPELYPVPWPDHAALRAHVASANEVYSTGSLSEIWRFSLAELPLFLSLHIFVFPRTLAFFLFGMFLWRSGLLRRTRDFMDELSVIAVVGIAAGAGLSGGAHAYFRAGIVLMALGYGAALLGLAQLALTRRWLSLFAPLGRMAFTNYVMQSVIFGFIFFGYGLGHFGRMGAATALLIGIGVYAGQMLLSRWWLRRHRFGPLEWLWRTLMYGVAQPMRKD